jgi:hypothetical protein
MSHSDQVLGRTDLETACRVRPTGLPIVRDHLTSTARSPETNPEEPPVRSALPWQQVASAELTPGWGARSIEGMARAGWATRHRGLILGAAVVAPLVVSAVMSMLRGSLDNTNAALVLVLLVVAAASTGIRLAGILAALSSAAWFDFFLTAPYLTFRINDRADIETTVLLVLVGAAVSETRIGAEGSKRRRVVMRAFWLASSKQRR